MNKKFNLEKWEQMLHKKEQLHSVYREEDKDADHEITNWGRLSANFYTNYRDCYEACELIKSDRRNLSSREVAEKLEQLSNNWDDARQLFGLPDGFLGKSSLLNLYKQMKRLKQAEERKQAAADVQQSYGACFTVLNEFAKKHNNHNKTRFDAQPQSESGFINGWG